MKMMFVTDKNVNEIFERASKLPENNECRKMAEHFKERADKHMSMPEHVDGAEFVIPVRYELSKESAEYIMSVDNVFSDMSEQSLEDLRTFASKFLA